MKALSILQPWASLIAIRAKRIETRSWYTPYRGPVAIHASARMTVEARELCKHEPVFVRCLSRAGLYRLSILSLGRIVATAVLTNCVPVEQLPPGDMTPQEFAFGDYSPGRYGWILENVRPLDKPVKARGKLGLWEWDPETK